MITPIAIKVLSPNSVGKRKLEANKIYYLLDGYEISENGYLYVSPFRLEKDIIFKDLYVNTANPDCNPDISISAIVGENGSGKSSLIEFYMRLVNNFAAATLGEYQTNPGAQHLHFINNIAGEYYYMINDIPYKLKVESRNVTLESYSSTGKIVNGRKEFLIHNTADIFDNEMSILPTTDDTIETPMQEWKFPKLMQKSPKNNLLNELYKHFFYTYISNYSIYAYNTNDYYQECNSDKFEELIRREKKKKYPTEYKNWLNGIFHKNDGYQTPIVLSPFRTKGNIDINTENILSRERLITLLIMPQSQFRIINNHLEVIGFKLSKKKIGYNAKYFNQNLGFTRLQQRGYEKFKNLSVKYWGEVIAEDLTKFSSVRKNYEEAIGYLVYKTLKTSKQYKQYNRFFRNHCNIAYKIDEEAFRKLIILMSVDHSHITRKIRQTLAYIVYGKYDIEKDTCSLAINEMPENTMDVMILEEEKNKKVVGKKFIYSIEELAPPPFYDIQIELRDIENGNSILFETLSSGERQQIYSISSFLYHLSNLDSVWRDSNKERISYRHINVIMEEIELYFHPELQRTYIKTLLDGIKQIHIPNIKSINICFVTHSPFILSDIPSRNILALKTSSDNTTEEIHLSTFGANIHDMLKNSFFLKKGSIGEYANHIINNIIQEMKDKKNNLKTNKVIDDSKIHERIMLIDEPIIRNALLGEYHRVFTDIDNEKRIKELQRQIDELKNY